MRPPKFKRLYEVMEINGVKVFAHWSVLLIGAIILIGAVSEPAMAFAFLGSYYGVILLHECGHMIAAQRKHCMVWSIELYPFWGITRFEVPYSPADHCVVAWGGIVAQTIVAVPIIVLTETFGYTRFQPLNALLAAFGFFSLFVAMFNLIPVPPLDWTLPFQFPHCVGAGLKPEEREGQAPPLLAIRIFRIQRPHQRVFQNILLDLPRSSPVRTICSW